MIFLFFVKIKCTDLGFYTPCCIIRILGIVIIVIKYEINCKFNRILVIVIIVIKYEKNWKFNKKSFLYFNVSYVRSTHRRYTKLDKSDLLKAYNQCMYDLNGWNGWGNIPSNHLDHKKQYWKRQSHVCRSYSIKFCFSDMFSKKRFFLKQPNGSNCF